MHRARPDVVAPGKVVGEAPADAIILFDGKNLDNWEANVKEKGVPTKWRLANGVLESVKKAGYIRTKQAFGDCQIHIEFATPTKVEGNSQGRGNSGVFLMGIYEVQVLDCYQNDTYPDGQTASIYGQNPPMVNVCRGPGEWQTYDIVFRQPVWDGNTVVMPGYMTIFQNGVLVQDHWVLEGPSGHMRRTKMQKHASKMPFAIQDHGNPVRFRNIWLRELPERTDSGLKMPYVKADAVVAKRAELAAKVREEAKGISNDVAKARKLLESLTYEVQPKALAEATKLASGYLATITTAKKAEDQKGTIMGLRSDLTYMVRFKILPADFAPKVQADKLVKEYKLDKK